MRFNVKIILMIVIAAGGIFMSKSKGDCGGPGYKEYSSEDAEINIMMDYVSDWRYQETRGSKGSYAQVQFYGVVTEGFAPSIIVTVVRSDKATFAPLTIEGLADDLVAKRARFEDTLVVSRSETKVAGLPAIDMTLTYKQPDQLRSLKFNMVAFRERAVVLQKGDRFYTLRYVNPGQAFEEFEQDFLHCIGTLTIKE